MSKQLILGVVLTLTLILSLNPAQASPPEIISHWFDNPPASGRMACSLEAKVKEKYFQRLRLPPGTFQSCKADGSPVRLSGAI